MSPYRTPGEVTVREEKGPYVYCRYCEHDRMVAEHGTRIVVQKTCSRCAYILQNGKTGSDR